MNPQLYNETVVLLMDQDLDGYTPNDGDCDDFDSMIHPDADEVCDGLDNDCNDLVDDEPVSGQRWYYDPDDDGCSDEWGLYCEEPDGSFISETENCQ